MGSFVFKWEHTANEVYVTGTFDGWSKSERLEKKGDIFSKNVTLSSADEKIYYKFVVDGNWVTDPTAPQENDASSNLNNVLTTDRIIKHKPEVAGIMSGVTPTSTTASLAKNFLLEKSVDSGSSALPGSFPETPAAVERGDFSVNPLPASEGTSNPIKLPAGESVPPPSSFTNNTVTSGVHDDPELVEQLKKQEEKEGNQTFGVSPLPAFPGASNPIKIAPGEKLPDPSMLTGSTIQSSVRTDPLSYEKSDVLGGVPVLPPVVTPQVEREQNGTGIFDLPPVSKGLIPESSLPIGSTSSEAVDAGPTIQSSGPLSTTALLAGAVPLESSKVLPTVQSSGPESTTAQLAGAVPLESSKVPEIVKESQKKAGFEPEASAVPEEVKEKSVVEKELESKVPLAPTTSEGIAGEGTTKTESSVSAGEAAAAVGGAFAALGGAAVLATSGLVSQIPAATTNLVNQLPTSLNSITSKLPVGVQESINNINTESNAKLAAVKDTPEIVRESIAESGQAPEAAANGEAVLEKKQVEQELLAEVKKVTSTGESAPKIGSSDTKLAAVKDTPEIVRESIAESGQAPEAAAFKESVLEKKDVEKELLAEVKKVNSTGQSAPKITDSASQIAGSAADLTAVKDTPEIVRESIVESGQAPEAAAYKEAVLEKKDVEKELLAEVKKVTSAGEPAPKITESAPKATPEAPAKRLETPVNTYEPDSRDVSPGTIPGSRVQTHTEPTVTTGVDSSTTAAKSGAGLEKLTEVSKPAEASTPAKSTAGSSKPTESPASASASQKKKNRASAFFSKLKSKLSDHK